MLGRPLAGTLSPVCVTVTCSVPRFPEAQACEGLERVPWVRPLPWACGGPRVKDRAPSTQVSFLVSGLSPKTVLWVCIPMVCQSPGAWHVPFCQQSLLLGSEPTVSRSHCPQAGAELSLISIGEVGGSGLREC